MRFLNIALLSIVAVLPAVLAVLGKEPAALVLLASLMIVLLALNISTDRLEELALGPLKAKLREKIAEADRLSDKLKRTISLMLTIAVSTGMRSGRFASDMGTHQRQIYDSALAIINDTGLSGAERETILADFWKYIEFDFRQAFVGNRVHSGSVTEPLAKSIRDISTPPEQALNAIRQLVEAYNTQSSELEEYLKDYSEVVLHRRFRRPDAWFNFRDERYEGMGLIRYVAGVK